VLGREVVDLRFDFGQGFAVLVVLLFAQTLLEQPVGTHHVPHLIIITYKNASRVVMEIGFKEEGLEAKSR
jgi:hypothetical protein